MAPPSGNAHDHQPLYLSTQPGMAGRWESRTDGAPSQSAQNALTAALAGADSRIFARLNFASRQFWLWLLIIALVGLAYGFINRFVVASVIVEGRSMVPTLQDGERYLLDRWAYHYRKPARGEVIVLRDPGHSDLAIKRIVGMPGDSVHLKDGAVHVNGKPFIEPYLASGMRTYTPNLKDQLVLLGDSQYFVLGDNRGVSEDSRFYGPVHRQRIVGCIAQ